MKRIRKTLCASLLTIVIASTAMAGNIGGLKTNAAGNIGGMRTNAAGNIGGLRTQATEQARELAEARENTLTNQFAGNIAGLLYFMFSMF